MTRDRVRVSAAAGPSSGHWPVTSCPPLLIPRPGIPANLVRLARVSPTERSLDRAEHWAAGQLGSSDSAVVAHTVLRTYCCTYCVLWYTGSHRCGAPPPAQHWPGGPNAQAPRPAARNSGHPPTTAIHRTKPGVHTAQRFHPSVLPQFCPLCPLCLHPSSPQPAVLSPALAFFPSEHLLGSRILPPLPSSSSPRSSLPQANSDKKKRGPEPNNQTTLRPRLVL